MHLARHDIHLWLSPQRAHSTHDFIQQVLAHYLPPQPRACIQLKRNPSGKPQLKDLRFRELQFNASHTKNLMVCAVAQGMALGVDVEFLPRKNRLKEIAERYFHPDEISHLDALRDVTQQRLAFFELWTCKEAYIKALGKTLGQVSLDTIPFIPGIHGLAPQFALPAQQHWHFHTQTWGDHIISLALCSRTWQATTKPAISIFVRSASGFHGNLATLVR